MSGSLSRSNLGGTLPPSPLMSRDYRAVNYRRKQSSLDTQPEMPGHDHEKAEGVVAWLGRWWRALVSELVSTALLVRLACSAGTGGGDTLLRGALAAGCLVVGNICAFGEASGAHMNPAFTLAALLSGKLGVTLALAYILAQCTGAVLGCGALVWSSPSSVTSVSTCVTLPAAGVSVLAALCTEVLSTCALVAALCAVWARPGPSAPLYIGLLVIGLVLAAGPTSGASFNPARSFGPALLQGNWTHHWVYWLGPLLGSALGTALHRWVLSPRPTPPAHDNDTKRDASHTECLTLSS